MAFHDGLARHVGRIAAPVAVGLALLAPMAAPAAQAGPERAAGAAATGPTLTVQFSGAWSDYYTDEQRESVLSQFQSIGVTGVRFDVSWEALQPFPADWFDPKVYTVLDHVIDMIKAHGMALTVTLKLTPYWARSQPDNAPDQLPRDPADFALVAEWAARRYAGKVNAWEIWSDPNPNYYDYTSTAREFTELMKVAYPAVKTGDPNATVVFGAILYNDDRLLRAAYQNGVKGFFDVMCVRSFPGLADESPLAPDKDAFSFAHLPSIRAVLDEYGDQAKPVWTILGYSTHLNAPYLYAWDRGVSEAQQALYLSQAVTRIRAQWPWVTQFTWYTDRDSDLPANAHYRHFGLLRSDLSPKPALHALAELIATGSTGAP